MKPFASTGAVQHLPHSTCALPVGVKPVFIAGLTLTVAGLLLFAGIDVDGAYVSDVLIPSLVVAFGPVNTESRWVELAHAGVEALDRPESRGKRAPPERTAFDAALRRAKSLKGTANADEAAAIFRALEELFRDDPDLQDALRTAREGK